MKLRYGSHTHDAGECAVSIEKTAKMAGDVVKSIVERWSVSGQVHGSSVSDLTNKIEALEAAYKEDGKDLRILTDTGGNTAHALLSSSTISGTRVIQRPSFPRGDGVEYATIRTFSLAVEAEIPLAGVALIEYRERIGWTGTGGATWRYKQPLFGEAQRQWLTAASVCQVVQEGFASALEAYPAFPAPIWPEQEHQELRMVNHEFPAKGSKERRTTWRFVFSSVTPLSGSPHEK